MFILHSLQPLTRKVDHIEWFRFHPGDTQNEIFDAIVNGMEIFAWVDENGEQCEYMYILDDKKEVYKMKMIPEETHKRMMIEGMDYTTATAWLIKRLEFMLYEPIETIPFLPASVFAYPLLSKYNKVFANYYIFKCRIWRFSKIRLELLDNNLKKLLPESGAILTDIDNYLLFDEDIISNRQFEFNYETEKGEEKALWRITSEDIEKGNAILKKVIAYLEETYLVDGKK